MREIYELHKRLVETHGKRSAKDEIQVHRGDDGRSIRWLSPELQNEVTQLNLLVASAVPDDVSYAIFLCGEEPGLFFEYEDGPQTAAFGGGPKLDANRSVVEQLQAYDWSKFRQDALSMTPIFEAMLDEVKDDPGFLPTTKQLQRRFREPMRAFLKKNRKPSSALLLLAFSWNFDDKGLTGKLVEENFEGVTLSGAYCDLMAMHHWVVTAVTDGKPIPVKRLEAAKARALKDMKEHMPMSYAKAMGKL